MSGKLNATSCKAARAILGWSTADLVREAKVSPNTVVKLEAGEPVGSDPKARIAAAFEANGVELLNGNSPGARLKG